MRSGLRNATACAQPVIPIAVDPHRVPRRSAQSVRVTFIGSPHWPPNAEGVEWFVRHRWPRAQASRRADGAGQRARRWAGWPNTCAWRPQDVLTLARIRDGRASCRSRPARACASQSWNRVPACRSCRRSGRGPMPRRGNPPADDPGVRDATIRVLTDAQAGGHAGRRRPFIRQRPTTGATSIAPGTRYALRDPVRRSSLTPVRTRRNTRSHTGGGGAP
jgi:hypothetical protein